MRYFSLIQLFNTYFTFSLFFQFCLLNVAKPVNFQTSFVFRKFLHFYLQVKICARRYFNCCNFNKSLYLRMSHLRRISVNTSLKDAGIFDDVSVTRLVFFHCNFIFQLYRINGMIIFLHLVTKPLVNQRYLEIPLTRKQILYVQ